jgi:gas vesicle protein
MSNNNNGLNVMAAVIVGALIGSVTATLLTPNSGKRTRKKLNRKLRQLNDQMEDLVADSRSSFTRMKEDTEDGLSDLVRKGKKIVN